MRRSLHHVFDPSRLQKYLKRKVPNFLLNDIKNNEYYLSVPNWRGFTDFNDQIVGFCPLNYTLYD